MPRAAALPRLHVVTDDAVLARPDWARAAESALEAGAAALALHVRGPRTGGATLHRLALRLVGPARAGGALLIVNDRVDVALAVGAAGAHLGARSLPPAEARRLLGPERWIGLSIHDPSAAGGPAVEGADYAFLGSILPTPSHPGVDALGVDALRAAVARAAGRPVLGIGGIGPEHVPGVRAAGAHGVAVLRGVWNHPRGAAEAVRTYLEVLEAGAPTRGREV